MKVRFASIALVLAGLSTAHAQSHPGTLSVLPTPPVDHSYELSEYPARRTAYSPAAYGDDASGSPSDLGHHAPQQDGPVYSDETVVKGPMQHGPVQHGPIQHGPIQHGPVIKGEYGPAPCAGGHCGSYAGGPCLGGNLHWLHPGCSHWYGGVYGLMMDRDNEDNEVWLSFDTNNVASRVLGSRDASMDLSGGYELVLGKYLGDGNKALEVRYWSVFPENQSATVLGSDQVGDLNTTLSFQSLVAPEGGLLEPVVDWYDGAHAHQLRRSYEIHNIELNLVGNPSAYTCGSGGNKFRFGWLAGFRFFKFDEGFAFAADEDDANFGDGDLEDELTYEIDVDNNLIGFQLGGDVEYCIHGSWTLFASARTGIYVNHVRQFQCIKNGTGFALISDPSSPYNGQVIHTEGSKNDASFLGEIDLGLRYYFKKHWAASVGYRAMGVTGVALTTDQIPANFGDFGGMTHPNTNGSLILHGLYAGVEFNY